MSTEITSPEKNPIEDLFLLIAIYYQILLLLSPDPGVDMAGANEDVEIGIPDRRIPEEAYSRVKRPTYTLEDMLAQMPEETSQDENVGTVVPDRRIPEEAYSRVRVRKPTYTLEDLLAQVTEDNLHDEIDTGPSVGNEV